MTLKAQEFIRRFLQHVLPAGFHKIRYYSLWSPANRKHLYEMKQLLNKADTVQQSEPQQYDQEQLQATLPSVQIACPHCKIGMLIWVAHVSRYGRSPP